ncbi:MAG: glycoside hydrolase family 9 protein [Bacteroidales bacterium]|nr:glycoside hydrolase family 9 protein [Bacteroidales bacterium]
MIKKISFILALSLSFYSCSNSKSNFKDTGQQIKIDQVGYKSISKKIAIIPDSTSNEFNLVNVVTGETVFSGKTTEPKEWKYSGTKVKEADFSDFNTEGIYKITCNGATESYPFAIGNNVYNELAIAAMKSYYFARAGVEITEQFGGKYARPAGHEDTKIKIHKTATGPKRKEGDIISSPRGWYDAGDYNKYVVNSSISVWELLNACELYPNYIQNFKLNIPESNNNLPDILDEILFNLRWMLTMQDPDDGGAYHKLTSLNFCGMVMPENDSLERYVIQKSTSATLDLAATCAKASRIIKNYENQLPGLVDSLNKTAKNAWNWAVKNPNVLYDKNPEGVSTGAYNDTKISDEWTWAAVEMFLTFNDIKYLNQINENDYIIAVPSWDSTSCLALCSILNQKDLVIQQNSDLVNFAKNKIVDLATQLYTEYENSAYKTPLNVFPWGSNSECANRGIILLSAYKVTNDVKYLEAAQACLHYILGRNPLDNCFVTGFGTKSSKDIHDRRSVADKNPLPVPGYLAGGPFWAAGADCGEDCYKDQHPAMKYYDFFESYSTNEIAINWNAALVMLVIALENE